VAMEDGRGVRVDTASPIVEAFPEPAVPAVEPAA
jgi:hypothetical protein